MAAPEAETNYQKQIWSLSAANSYLAVNLHRLLAEAKGNVCFSPFSVSTTMAMLLCAAEGETESEMRVALGYDTAGMKRGEIASAFEQQMLLLDDSDSYTLLCAKSMLSKKDFKLKEGYKQLLTESFKALLSEVDFRNDNERSVKQLNEWVKEQTHNMIPELVQSLNPETNIVLLNAVYFKGTWLEKFDKEETSLQNFYNKGSEDNIKKVEMMHIKQWYFSIYGNESFVALELPYVGEEIAMIILVPHKKKGLESMEADLTPSFLGDINANFMRRRLKLFMPRFHLEYSKELSACFKKLGINRVFGRGAELGGAIDSPDISVSEIVHKAVLEVNEEGRDEAASTADFDPNSDPPKFIVDHPFMFIVYDIRSDFILFMGRVVEL